MMFASKSRTEEIFQRLILRLLKITFIWQKSKRKIQRLQCVRTAADSIDDSFLRDAKIRPGSM
jgi:hypothetical protein